MCVHDSADLQGIDAPLQSCTAAKGDERHNSLVAQLRHFTHMLHTLGKHHHIRKAGSGMQNQNTTWKKRQQNSN